MSEQRSTKATRPTQTKSRQAIPADVQSTTEITDPDMLVRRVRSLFDIEHVDFPEVLVSESYRPHLFDMYDSKVDPKQYVTEIEKRLRLEAKRRKRVAARAEVKPAEVAPTQEQPDTFLDRKPQLRARYDNPSLDAGRYAAKRQPRPTLDKIIPKLRKRDVRLTLSDATMSYVQWRLDGMKMLYDTLYAKPPPLDVSKAYWESRLRLETRRLRKQHPEIADLPDLVARNIAHAAAQGWPLSYRLHYGSNVKMLREAGRNYAFQFPDGLGVVEIAPSSNQAFNGWLASTTFMLKTVAVWFDEAGKDDWEPHATFQFLDVDVVGVANKLLAKGGTKLPTEALQRQVKAQYGIELHDREIAQFMSDATGWHGPKQLRIETNQVRGYERRV
jgi:hypothetical protein